MNRELVSYIVLSYNQQEYIKGAIESALNQSYQPLEILISDDGSTDNSIDIIKKTIDAYIGPHTIRLNINDKNLGVAYHKEYLTRIAAGDIIICGDGDDVSDCNRTQKIVDEFKADDNCMYVHSYAKVINSTNQLVQYFISPGLSDFKKLYSAAAARSLALGATAAWRKEVVTDFQPLIPSVWSDDLIFGFRALLIGSVRYIDEPLVGYRQGIGVASVKQTRFQRHKRDLIIRKQRFEDSFLKNKFLVCLRLLYLMINSSIKMLFSGWK